MVKVAIIGATGVVGRTLINIINERKLDGFAYYLFSSKKSAGSYLTIGDKNIIVNELDGITAQGKFDFAFFCTKEQISSKFIPYFLQNKAIVVDFSSHFRRNKPLIVPQINHNDIKGNLICNPNCSTIAGVMALYKIYERFGLKNIIYSTFQAVSGAGKVAIDDLVNNKQEFFKTPISDNLIPKIGDFDKYGNSKEENKMIFETKKILGDKNIKISATCVRVPITIGHSLSINFQTAKKCSLKQIKDEIKNADGVKLFEDDDLAMPIMARNQDLVLVSRVRTSEIGSNWFSMFVSSDNLRKGSAQNAIEIFEVLLERFYKEG
ncbi:MAG: aspartate-semialdehyde dehydrogenase [Clostridia bacterium]|nr:aspartate-semialdehyde dehydrogenase [Clostridia bacterium]